LDHNLIEVFTLDEANVAYVINDHRNLGFTNDKYYPLYERKGEKYALDDRGKENTGITMLVKAKLYKFKNKIHSNDIDFMNNLNKNIDYCFNNLQESVFELFEELGGRLGEMTQVEEKFYQSVLRYMEATERR